MSLIVDKDNIFFILPEDRYSISSRTDGMMDKDFTLYAKFKIFPEELEINKEAFAFSRNGMHSGISVTKVDENKCIINYSYWFVKTNTKGKYEYICKQIYYEFDINELNEFNEYVMICDNHDEKKIDCYFNKKLIGTIEFGDYDKLPYEQAFYWFGCGDMLSSIENRNIGKFEFDTAFVLNKAIDKIEVDDIIENYKKKYTYELFDGLRKLNFSYPLRKHFAFFCDFNQTTRYKVWDMTFSGNYPQIYIKNNIYF